MIVKTGCGTDGALHSTISNYSQDKCRVCGYHCLLSIWHVTGCTGDNTPPPRCSRSSPARHLSWTQISQCLQPWKSILLSLQFIVLYNVYFNDVQN